MGLILFIYRQISINDSTLTYANFTYGHIAGSLSTSIAPSNTEGIIGMSFNVVDNEYQTVAMSDFTGMSWYSNSLWSNNGNVVAISTYELLSDDKMSLVTWNATGAVLYNENQDSDSTFVVLLQENPLSVVKNIVGKHSEYNHQVFEQSNHKVTLSLGTFKEAAVVVINTVSDVIIQSTNVTRNDELLIGGYGTYGVNDTFG